MVRTVRSCCFAALVACLGVFGLDALLFRTPFYSSVLEPDSSTGLFELILRREREAQVHAGDNLVVTLGNSRFGYSPKVLDQSPVKTGYLFRQAGIAGSTPRAWYYMLRDLDPTAQRYRAVVLGVDDFDDEDRGYNPDDDVRDLHFVIARLRLSDVIEFARSFQSTDLKWAALRGGLLKGIIYQNDIHAFLSHPSKRIAYVNLANHFYPEWTYNYVETDRNMVGLKIDWPTLHVTFPRGLDEDQRGTVNDFLAHLPDPQTGRLAAFRRTWFGRIINRYRGFRTKIIFVQLPKGPIPRPNNLVRKQSSSIRELASLPNVLLADEHAFDALEHPELYRDGVHLNREGINRFSVMLADEIARLLGPSANATAR